MARSLTSDFSPALQVGENVILFPRGKAAKSKRSDGSNNIHKVTNVAAFPEYHVNLGSLDAATAASGASKTGSKTALKGLLEVAKNNLLQLRFAPLLDFEIEFFQPNDVPHYRVLVNDFLRASYRSAADSRLDPHNEFWHYEDASISMTAVNPHRRALATTPVRLSGWAYRLKPRTIGQAIADVKARLGETQGAKYDAVYQNALQDSQGDPNDAGEAVILQMLRDGALRALYAPVEASF